MYSSILLEFLNMGGGEIMLIMVVVLLLFGGKKLPELARGLGKGIRDFKDASEGVKREIHKNINAIDLDNEMKAEEAEDHANRHHPAVDNQMAQADGIENDQLSETEVKSAEEIIVENKSNEVHS